MLSPLLFASGLATLLTPSDAAETVLGAYIFHRHGDRSAKSTPPTSLTTLGYQQVYTSGQYYRSRYVNGSSQIKDLSSDSVKLSQLSVTAPVDNVLQSSAMGFLQGLYPPVDTVQTLGNGTKVEAPLNGYQLIPVNTIDAGTGSEDNGWLQDASGCQNAKWSSNKYFESSEYQELLSGTKDFYKKLLPVVKNTFEENDVTFKNAYVVYDLLNVAKIHNSSIPSSEILTDAIFAQTRTLADAHEWGLAYNSSDNMRAVTGMQLAGEILKYMNNTIASGQAGKTSNKLGVQFGAYATFMSFFGLANMPKVNADFMGMPDYASSMVFELFTDSEVKDGEFPASKDLQVRFLFHNGTASASSEPEVYPLFGSSSKSLSWEDFSDGLNKFAILTTEEWCNKCGNKDGPCAAYAETAASTQADNGSKGSGHGMSAAVGGVIGAMITLAVVLGSLAAVMLLGGLRLVPKRVLVRPEVTEKA
ncbi:phosphoglycerate mutase-like protein [Delitschia confertaspora ATCC 74209]|uniref:Phosphoglycerate mutase-like protein n=1 Tax=Delitschia confertaspora ATCC 74209 TaxID=1513339 RepID=A0A9P4JW78_9PLEO|nr:phosphoglycerate mutase-like protein [Delitschia confertaspora ATCC 74209]